MVYFDNAATSMPKPDVVIQAVTQAMHTMGNSGRGVHQASLDSSRTIYETRRLLAELFHAPGPSCIAFTMNATESLNIAIQGILNPGDHVITTALEHNSVLRPLYHLQSRDISHTVLSADARGCLYYEDFEKAIRKNTRAVICTHASNLTGNLVDIQTIGELCQKHGLLFVLDASQTAGLIPIDVEKMHIDIVCFTGHKSLLGPQGTGGLYVRPGLVVQPLLSGGSGVQTYLKHHPLEMPTALEAGTLNGHGIAGLRASLQYIMERGIENIWQEEMQLTRRFYEGLTELSGVKIYGDFSDFRRCPIVAMNLFHYDSSKISDLLFQEYAIAVRAGAHCAPLMHEALGTVQQGALRFSFSSFNTVEEIDYAIKAIQELTI